MGGTHREDRPNQTETESLNPDPVRERFTLQYSSVLGLFRRRQATDLLCRKLTSTRAVAGRILDDS
jgi:hypothetical protein